MFKKIKMDKEILFSTKNLLKLMSSKLTPTSTIVQIPRTLSESESRLNLANFVYTYFRVIYYLGACPFRFQRDSISGYFYIKTCKTQQVLCAVMNILCIFRLIGNFRVSLPENISSLRKKPASYFQMVLGVCSLIFKVVTMKRFWMHKREYLKILEVIKNEPYLNNKKPKITSTHVCSFSYGIFVLPVIACLIGGYSFIDVIWEWTPSWWLRRLVALARFTIGFGERLKPGLAPKLSEITITDGFLSVLMIFSELQRQVVGFFWDLSILSVALTLWVTASSFAENIFEKVGKNSLDCCGNDRGTDVESQIKIVPVRGKESIKDNDWRSIYQEFKAIQRLSAAINAALGSQVTWYMGEALMYYSINMNSVFLSKDWFRKAMMLLFYLESFCVLYFSMDICNKLESVKVWMTYEDNIKKIPPEEARLVMHELIVKDIGIRGSNVFTLTYPLVATFLSLIITFFIICIQQSD